ncbi:MAG: flavodoxin-dependent (E)-4-hydroxy-3-methylbut-2-enyl-diphosphate synthase, partial [Marinoscillum sp.]
LDKNLHLELNFLKLSTQEINGELMESLKGRADIVLLLHSENIHAMADMRRVFIDLINHEVKLPVVIQRSYQDLTDDAMMMYPATDMGGLLIVGFGDGVMLGMEHRDQSGYLEQAKTYNHILFGILQAARTRISKTEYISCPSCGRTLFDLQETTAMIRKRTDHLKGVKIGIMGCIVNGPGEMADADYGYVGSGKGKITLYKGQEVMKRGVPSERALDELIELIKEDGKWTEPQVVLEY